VFADDRYLDVAESLPKGTIRLKRTDGTLCAAIDGHHEVCHDKAFNNRVWIQIYMPVSNAACSDICGVTTTCCNYQARISNLRLKRGLVRALP
jgi:hypothetical protein